jgi:hypothetical protein
VIIVGSFISGKRVMAIIYKRDSGYMLRVIHYGILGVLSAPAPGSMAGCKLRNAGVSKPQVRIYLIS